MSASLKAVDGLRRWHAIWLGGIKLDNEWQWADDATWRFTNWRHDPPKKYIYLLMKTDGLWSDYMGSDQNYFLCQGATVGPDKKWFCNDWARKRSTGLFSIPCAVQKCINRFQLQPISSLCFMSWSSWQECFDCRVKQKQTFWKRWFTKSHKWVSYKRPMITAWWDK